MKKKKHSGRKRRPSPPKIIQREFEANSVVLKRGSFGRRFLPVVLSTVLVLSGVLGSFRAAFAQAAKPTAQTIEQLKQEAAALKAEVNKEKERRKLERNIERLKKQKKALAGTGKEDKKDEENKGGRRPQGPAPLSRDERRALTQQKKAEAAARQEAQRERRALEKAVDDARLVQELEDRAPLPGNIEIRGSKPIRNGVVVDVHGFDRKKGKNNRLSGTIKFEHFPNGSKRFTACFEYEDGSVQHFEATVSGIGSNYSIDKLSASSKSKGFPPLKAKSENDYIGGVLWANVKKAMEALLKDSDNTVKGIGFRLGPLGVSFGICTPK